jgi:3-hydroxyisobutyrate dehydrogenase
MSSTPQKVGIIGLGIIGSRVAANLLKAGHEVYGWNRTPQSEMEVTPASVAQKARVVQIFVRDDEALAQVLDAMKSELTSEHVVLNHSTVSPQATKRAAEEVQSMGAAFLDAPFTGSKMAAQNGKLVYYVGGDLAVLERVRTVLEASSSKIMHVGEVGHATILKITTNMITAITVKGVEEALRVTTAHGVAAAHLLATEEANANFSPLIGMKLPAMIQGEFDAHFSLKNMLKDADYALALAYAKGVATPALEAMAEAMREAQAAGLGESDFSIIGRQ